MFLTIFQSIFGIGLLVFGTPIFLIIGYNYFDALAIILPFSICISLLQIFSGKMNDHTFSINLLKFTIPALIFTLVFLRFFKETIEISFFISFFLIFFALINIFYEKKNIFKYIKIQYSLFALGIIHGLTNLGGSFLTLIISNIKKNKREIRHDIAISYLILSTIQYLYVIYIAKSYNNIYLKFLIIAVFIYFFSQKFFRSIESRIYKLILNICILFIGLYLLILNLK